MKLSNDHIPTPDEILKSLVTIQLGTYSVQVLPEDAEEIERVYSEAMTEVKRLNDSMQQLTKDRLKRRFPKYAKD